MALLPSKTRKGTGFLLDTDKSHSTFGVDRLGLVSSGLPLDNTVLEGFIPRDAKGVPIILDQQNTSSCVAHTFAGGIHICEGRAGLSYIPVSRRAIYYNSRREHGAEHRDAGTYLRTCAHALRTQGAPDEKYWEWAQLGIALNKRPSWDAMRHAHPRRGGEYFKIYETGEQRLLAVKAAIQAGYPVGFGTALAHSFGDMKGSAKIEKPTALEKIWGHHAMLIIGWVTGSDGRVWFRVLNSWGPWWRDHGLCWLSAEYVIWSESNDFHIIRGWDRIRVGK